MKNQYVADINDYRKYGLLRTLACFGEIRTCICWMLTPDDNRTDGKFTDYLKSSAKWKHYDPSLFDCLEEYLNKEKKREIRFIETSGILPNAIFHSDTLTDGPRERFHYFIGLHKLLNEVDLIFFDPDNGLEIKSRLYGCKNSSKYLYWNEVKDVYEAGKSVLVYQHFRRETREQFMERLALEFCDRLSVSEVISFRTPHVVFFLASQPEHFTYFRQRSAAVSDKWGQQITVKVHETAQQRRRR